MEDRFDKLAFRYLIECLLAAGCFVLASLAFREVEPDLETSWMVMVVALVSMIPMGYFFWASVRYFRQVDERERFIMALAGALTLALAVFSAMLLARLDAVFAVNMNYFAAFLCFSWSAITSVIRRYR